MFTVRVEGLDAAARRVTDLSRQLRFAAARALNDVAFQDVRPALQSAMETDFDRPTPWVKQAIHVERATPARLAVTISTRYAGGKGTEPRNVLGPEVKGGARHRKRAELAFQRAGILAPGQYLVPSKALLADGENVDAYGNVKGAFLVQLLSYFNAFGEQGYRANMTDKRRAKLSGRGRWINGRFVPVGARGYDAKAGQLAFRKGGIEYFVSHGRGTRAALPSEGRQGREQHLPAGVWSRSGLTGGDVKPVLLFVRAPVYPVRYRMGDIVQRTVQRALPARLAASVRQALATAR